MDHLLQQLVFSLKLILYPFSLLIAQLKIVFDLCLCTVCNNHKEVMAMIV